MNIITSTTKYSFPPSVVMLGKFDGVHLGHTKLIETGVEFSQNEGLSSIVYTFEGINNECITTDDEKADIFEKLGVRYTIFEKFTEEFKSITPEYFVKNILADKLNAKRIVVGFNYRFGKGASGDTKLLGRLCAELGIKLSVINPFEIEGTLVSSTHIRNLLSQGDVKMAEKFLGRPYTISGITSKGKGLGHTIGFATANISDEFNKLLPKRGVYASNTIVDGKSYMSMTNVGINPTVENIDKPKVETHIIDYKGELYGESITIEFVNKIRDEKRFNSVEDLKAQLIADRGYVKKYFNDKK